MQAAACTGYSARPSSKETVLTINVSQCRQWSHLREQADRIGMRLVATQFAIDHCYVDDDTFAVRPRGIAIQRYILCRLEYRHTRLVSFARLVIDVFEVERAEGVDCERASLPHRRSLLEEHSKLRRLQAFDHFVCSLLRSDNLRIGYQLIAIAMIPVGVCVDHHVNV